MEPVERLLTISDVCRLLGVSRRWWYRRIREVTAPPPFRVGDSRPRYQAAQVQAWIEENVTYSQTARPRGRRRA